MGRCVACQQDWLSNLKHVQQYMTNSCLLIPTMPLYLFYFIWCEGDNKKRVLFPTNKFAKSVEKKGHLVPRKKIHWALKTNPRSPPSPVTHRRSRPPPSAVLGTVVSGGIATTTTSTKPPPIPSAAAKEADGSLVRFELLHYWLTPFPVWY